MFNPISAGGGTMCLCFFQKAISPWKKGSWGAPRTQSTFKCPALLRLRGDRVTKKKAKERAQHFSNPQPLKMSFSNGQVVFFFTRLIPNSPDPLFLTNFTICRRHTSVFNWIKTKRLRIISELFILFLQASYKRQGDSLRFHGETLILMARW